MWRGSWVSVAFLSAALAAVGSARAQDGGSTEKKDPPEKKAGEEPEKKKPVVERTLAFEKPAGWKEGKGARGFVKAVYKTDGAEGDSEGGTVQVRLLGPKPTWDTQLDFYTSHYEDKDGKKLEKGAVKTESLEANGVKISMAEFAGTFVPGGRKSDASKDESEKPAKKVGQKTIGCFLEGPDGGWAVAIWGTEKSVDKAREDFLKFVKSFKVIDKPSDEKPGKGRKKDDDGDGD